MFNTKLMKIFYAGLVLGNLFIPMKRGIGNNVLCNADRAGIL